MNKILYNGQVIIDLDELADKYTKAEVDALVSSVFKYKGTVATKDDLENIVDKKIGDCYNVEADGINYAWNGEEWSALSGTVDLTNYYTKEQADGKFGSYLAKNNTTEYTPVDNYNPATKKYVDDSIKNAGNVLELNGVYNDADATAGYDFSVDDVNAIISKLGRTQSNININLQRNFDSKVEYNSIIGNFGFNKVSYTEGNITEEISLQFITVSDGAYLRFYGSATLMDGVITTPLHCYSDDYSVVN